MKLTDYRDKIKLEKVRYNPNNKLLTFYIGEQKFSYSIVYIFLSELREYYKQRLRDSEGDIDKYLSLCSDACQSFNLYSDFLSVYVDIDAKKYSKYFLNQLECLKHTRDSAKEKEQKTNQNELIDFDQALKIQHKEELKNWIWEDNINWFIKVEKELLQRKYLDTQYKWIRKKKELIDFLIILNEYNVFRKNVSSIKKQDFHYRQFISFLYGFGKKGLTESSKKYKPTLDLAKASFYWIEKDKK